MSGAIAGGMHKRRLPVVILTWYKSLVLKGGGSVELSIITVELFLAGASLNPINEPAGPWGWGERALDKGLVKLLGRGDM